MSDGKVHITSPSGVGYKSRITFNGEMIPCTHATINLDVKGQNTATLTIPGVVVEHVATDAQVQIIDSLPHVYDTNEPTPIFDALTAEHAA